MVDPIITYAFAIGFFVVILGSMLYLTFMDHPENGRDAVGESVVGGVDAVDDQETGELAGDATGDADVEPREHDDATVGVGAERDDETTSGGSDGGAVDGATAGADEAVETPTDEQAASEAAETDEE